jgi:tetratricopeptide (TPR) repeat protein
MRKLAILLAMLAAISSAADSNWLKDYQTGLDFIAQSRYSDAIVFLVKASNAHPVSEIIRRQDQTIDYLPYLHLGICYSNLGNKEIAKQYFELERKLGTIQESANGMLQLERYDVPVRLDVQDSSHQQIIREFKRKPVLLPDQEMQAMKDEIRKRCRLDKKDERYYPWYYHYELGLALKEKNDWQRALDSFISALDKRNKPNKFTRTYGVWYVEYYPYYQIGIAHYNLQNWKCATSSFRLSEMLEDIRVGDDAYRSREEYKMDAEQKSETQ